MFLPGLTLWQREIVRFLRQRNRVVGALVTPVVFWALLGSGLGRSFQTPFSGEGHGYLEFFFAGTILLILLFTAIFSTISLIEDRREGFLQAVLVAPVSHRAVVIGKVLGGASLALLQGLVFLLLAPLIGLRLEPGAVLWLVTTMAVLSIGLTGLGFVIAWPMESTQGFHAIMNLFLMPLWFLSGALFPAAGAPVWLQWVMKLNPLSYGLAGLRHGLYAGQPEVVALLPSRITTLTVSIVFSVAMCVLALILARRTTTGDLQ